MPLNAKRPASHILHMTRKVSGVLALAVLLAGCAETQLAMQGVKVLGGQRTPSPTTGAGHYKIGKPYEIAGQWYYPAVDYEYRETGIASWYGPKFHGKYTANGEIFDQNAVTAAHRTLPLPSIVRVTNLENGRSIKVRVNDRGPYARGRIMDMSRRAAQLLGFEKKGTAKVLVEILPEESRQAALQSQGGSSAPKVTVAEKNSVTAAPRTSVETVSLDSPEASSGDVSANTQKQNSPASDATQAPKVEQVALTSPTSDSQPVSVTPVAPSAIYVQAGAFSVYDNALNLRNRLYQLAPTKIEPIDVKGTTFYRVRLGPLNTVPEADILLQRVINSGTDGARVVVECSGGVPGPASGCDS